MGARTYASVTAALALLLTSCASASELADSQPQTASSAERTQPSPTTPPTTKPTPSQTKPTSPKTSKPTKPPLIRLPRVIGSVARFRSPTGNIGCQITADFVRCDIGERSYNEPAQPPDCGRSWGNSVTVGRGEAGFACVNGSIVGGPVVLQYGTSSRVGDFGCTSRFSGMQCYNLVTGRGFLLSRENVAFS